jgi:exosortase/archaeosortase family protein
MANFKSIFTEIADEAKLLAKKYRLAALTDVALFILITVVIHFAWRFWVNTFNYWPVQQFMSDAQAWLSIVVFDQSTWFISHILQIPMTLVEETNTMYFANKGYMAINQSCSGLKQIMQFVLLIALIRGPWKRKWWFILLGIFIVHLTNLFRVTGLSVVITTWPEYWDFSHDNIFRPFFYIVIFSLWVWWVERISVDKKPARSNPE